MSVDERQVRDVLTKTMIIHEGNMICPGKSVPVPEIGVDAARSVADVSDVDGKGTSSPGDGSRERRQKSEIDIPDRLALRSTSRLKLWPAEAMRRVSNGVGWQEGRC